MIIDSGVRLALSAYHDSGARQDIHRRSRDPVTRDQAPPGDVASHVSRYSQVQVSPRVEGNVTDPHLRLSVTWLSTWPV
jgi:hypothetical protein